MANTTSTTQFKADISQLKSAMQQAQRQVKLANSEFKAASAGMEDWSDSAEGLQAKLKQLDTTLKSQKTQLSLLEDEYEKTKTVYGENSAAADKVKISINNMKAAINKTESQITEYTQDLQDCEQGTGRFADETEDLDSALQTAGDGFTVFKGVLSDLISNVIQSAISTMKDLATEVVEVGSSFEKSMSNVQALSGATDEELQMLSDTAKEFGANTQFSATEAADALSYMALAGWDAQTSCDALGGVLDLAASSGMDLAEASDMVTDYMSAFSMEASESSYFADLLSYAQSNANTTAEGLGEAFKNCAANMNAAGQDIETTTSLLSSMANQGLKGSEAGTALTATVRDLTKNMSLYDSELWLEKAAEEGLTSVTGDLNDIMGKNAITIGNMLVPVSDAQGNFRDLTDILKDVETATDGLGDAEKSSALMATFTSDSIKGLNLMLNAGIDEAADFEEQLRNCSGTASDMAKVMNDNLAGDLTALNSKIEGVKITVYESLVPALRDGVAELSDTIDSVDWSDVGKKVGELSVTAVKFFKSIIENADGIKTILQAVGTALGTAFVISKVSTFATSIISLWKTFQTLKTATEAATASQLLLNAAQMATPIGLVTAAVAGLAAGLIYLASKQDEARESVETLSEYEQKEIDKVNELKQAYEDCNASRSESISTINTEYGYYQTLADELDGLVDANGNVKAGYEDRVNFILTTLNEAVGTEMALVDGVIQNYQDEKTAIDNLIESKKAEAILSASQESYTQAIQNQNEALQNMMTTTGIYTQNVAEMDAAQKAYNDSLKTSIEEYSNTNGIYNYNAAAEALGKEQDALKQKLIEAKSAVGQSRVAMENAKTTYEGFQTTIKNYEGLSSAIISGDADKISTALTNLEYNFQTAETSTRESLEKQVTDYEENLANLETAIKNGTPAVTDEMVAQAKSMVKAAKSELDKLPSEAEEAANKGANTLATTFSSDKNKKQFSTAVKDTVNSSDVKSVLDDNSTFQTGGENYIAGMQTGILNSQRSLYDTVYNTGVGATNQLNTAIDANSPSRKTQTSGEWFGQGFINGMNNKSNSIWTTAWNLAKTALNALKAGQQEGSPSKLTYQSGRFFTQGYINGIASLQTSLVNTVKSLVTAALKQASDVSNYNFSEAGMSVADTLASQLTKKTNYMINKMTYQNEQKVAEFDKEISSLESKRDKEVAKLNKEKASASAKLQKASDKKVASLEAKKKKAKTQKEKDKYTKEIATEKKNVAKSIANSDKSFDKKVKAEEKNYNDLIAVQNKYKTAYQDASAEFISEFSDAINDYSSKAQELINTTINDVADKYQAKYDELIQKQDTLVDKLKSAGDLFNISGAGVMTVNDLKEQTRQITEYTNKLAKIKEKVSSELFDQIAAYDLKEGSAFMDRLLAMTANDLEAYNQAYTEKMQAAEKAGEQIYGADIKKVGAEYKTELEKALSGLPQQLQELGSETMKSFVTGLTENTDYMSNEVQTFIKSMVDNLTDELNKELSLTGTNNSVAKTFQSTYGMGLVNSFQGVIDAIANGTSKNATWEALPLDFQTGIDFAKDAVNTASASSKAGKTAGASITNYTFNQTNNSPKSLSALDTYTASREMLAMVKAYT